MAQCGVCSKQYDPDEIVQAVGDHYVCRKCWGNGFYFIKQIVPKGSVILMQAQGLRDRRRT